MTIHIEALSFECIVGILDFERIEPQRVIIDVQIDYEYSNREFINYAEVISLIEKEMKNKKFELLESALNSLSQTLLAKFPNIQKLYLKITKPNIIRNAQVSLSDSWINIQN